MASPSATEDLRYWAFICYAPGDHARAAWLLRSMETYRLPKSLVAQPALHGPVPKRLYPLFLDREELPAAASRGDAIEWALRQSRWLIVLCSPEAGKCGEVDRQIRFFKSLGREDRVLCVRLAGPAADRPEGGPDSDPPLPEAARWRVDERLQLTDKPAEPRVVDARPGRDSKRTARLRLIAHVLGVDFAELKHRDRDLRFLRLRLWFAGISLLFTVYGVLMVQLFFEKVRADDAVREAEFQHGVARHAERVAIRARKAAMEAEQALEELRGRTGESPPTNSPTAKPDGTSR